MYAALTGRWLWASVLAAFAGLTRPLGVAVVAAIAVAAAIALVRSVTNRGPGSSVSEQPGRWRVAVGALVAPLGWVGYLVWVGIQVGHPLGYLQVTSRWGNGFDGGVTFAGWILAFFTGGDIALGFLLCAALGLLAWLYVLCVRMPLPLPLLVFSAVLIFLALTTSGYFGSKPRYLLPAFPLLFPLAVALARANA